MATKTILPKTKSYGTINRGTSLTIPVTIKTPEDKPVDLTGLTVAFTIKKVVSDFDREDLRAYVQKNFAPQEPEEGRFLIYLTSADTDFEPGQFYFDIEIIDELSGMVHRIVTLEFELLGGPTNRTVNTGVGQLPIGNEITIVQLAQGNPIIVIAPMMALSPGLYGPIADLTNLVDAQKAKIEDLENQIETLKDKVDDIDSIINP